MTQSAYSASAEEYILKNHPVFAESISYKDDDSFDCFIKSDKGHLFIWIATYDSEITIGFETADGKCDWHTHMSLYNAYEPEEDFIAMTGVLQLILSGGISISFSSESGYTLFEGADPRHDENGDVLSVFKWSEL